MSRSYAIRTYGCQMNEDDSSRLAAQMEAEGLVVAADESTADVVILNTCCVRENADNKLYGALGNLKVRKETDPDFQIVVAGCLAQKDQELIRQKAGHVDVVVGTHNVHRAAALLRQATESGPVTEIWTATETGDDGFLSVLPPKEPDGYSAWVTIQIGCDNSCAFCIVPAVRGPEISRPFGDLIDEVTRLAAAGVVEVTLLGQNVNSYGRDLTLARRGRSAESADLFACGETWVADASRRARPLFADLLRAVGSIDGIRRVRFTSPHPKDLREDTIAAMAETPAVCPQLHLPLQAGNDNTLRAMQRGYTVERYLERLATARREIPDLAVTTDLIVGFPGETEEEFVGTLEVAAEVGFDAAFTFVYSPRSGTAAAERVDEFLPRSVTAERMERLRAVVERSSHARNRDRVGRVEEVIVEGPSKKDPDVLSGRTRQNKLVHFPASLPLRPGTFGRVSIVEAHLSYLAGEFLDVTAKPRHRTHIPVLAG